MAIASAPSVINNLSLAQWAGRAAQAVSQRADRNVVKVGTVVVAPGDNATVPLGGFFDVYFDKSAHALLLDIVSTQVGGPV